MIRIENLSFAFGGNTVFDGFSLDIPYGVSVIQGPSGCGKTTLLKLIADLIKPDSGRISGVPGKISFMFQDDRLLPWLTAEKNVAAVLPKHQKHTAIEFLKAVELSDEAGKLPNEMSGGQRRRVALSRALAFGGELLILDEPFKGLDPGLSERMARLVKNSFSDIIMTSHSAFEQALMGGAAITL